MRLAEWNLSESNIEEENWDPLDITMLRTPVLQVQFTMLAILSSRYNCLLEVYDQ